MFNAIYHKNTAEILNQLAAGAELSARYTSTGNTSLHYAAATSPEILEFLLTHPQCKEVDECDEQNKYPLQILFERMAADLTTGQDVYVRCIGMLGTKKLCKFLTLATTKS